MKVLSRIQALALATLGATVFCGQAGAQNLSFSVTAAPDSLATSNLLTYTISVTNFLGNAVNNVVVTNSISGPFILVASTPTNSLFTDGVNLIFAVGSLVPSEFRVMTLTIRPLTAGTLTNRLSLDSDFTTNFITSIFTLVTNAPPPVADVAVAMTGPPYPVVINDYFTFGVTASNLGPGSASGVVLTNQASTNLFLIRFTPTNQPATITTNGLLLFNLSVLTNGAIQKFTVTSEPVHTGTLTLSAIIGSIAISDPDTNNNIAFTNITVSDLVTNLLIATNASAMVFNPQTSLMQQTIRLVNISPSITVDSARVIVKGLTNRLYNAVGTNTLGGTGLHPFVIYPAPLAPGESVDLLMEYFIPNRLPITIPNSNYVAVATPAANLAVTALASLTLTNFALTNGSILLEFPATPGQTYQVQYSSDASFATGVFLAQPPVVAQADRVQWVDDGPPKTVSHPTNTPMRFYRVQLNP